MSDPVGFATGPWVVAFMIGCYASAALCLLFGVSEWLRKNDATQLVLFVLLGFFFVFLESFGEIRIPFYNYTLGFHDRLPPLPLSTWLPNLVPDFSDKPAIAHCQTLVNQEGLRLPVSVPLMEATLTFTAMGTARLLGAQMVVRPILAGIALLVVDSVLDPIVATSFDNTPSPAVQLGRGLGLWRWQVVKDLAPDGFGIPRINYGIWFAGPVVVVALISLVVLVRKHWRSWSIRSLELRWLSRSEMAVALSLVISAACFLVIKISPGLSHWPLGRQRLLFWTAIGAGVVIFVESWISSPRDARVQWEFVLAQLFFLLFPVTYLLATDPWRDNPPLLLNAAVFVWWGTVYVWSPYGGAASRYRRFIAKCDGYLRFRYLSYTALLALLGAASVLAEPSTPMLIGLLLVAFGFNVVSFLVNDWIDLPVDRTQPRRQNDPQVKGDIAPWQSLTIACTTVPVLFGVTALLGGPVAAHAALLAGLLLMTAYNVWGKRCPFPPLTDLIQGMAWGSLAIYGATLAGHTTNLMSWLVAAYGAIFMLLVNGVHGGLRDLENDLRHNLKTTAIYLSAQPDGAGGVVSTPGLRRFAGGAHVGLLLVLAALLLLVASAPASEALWPALITTVVLAGWSTRANAAVVAERASNRDLLVTRHLFIVLLPLLVVSLPVLSALMQVVVILAYFGPLLFANPDVSWVLPGLLSPRTAPAVGNTAAPTAPVGALNP